MDIELFYTPKTRSLRPRWLLEELEIPYSIQPVDLFGGASNPIHPLGSVPAMRVDGEVMFESGAMCHWLADRFPEQGLAPPAEDARRPAYEQWMFFCPGTLEPPAFDILMHSAILPEAQRVSEIVGYAEARYAYVLGKLAEQLEDRDYLTGPSFSTADIMTGSTLQWLPGMLEPHPVLQAYVQRITARDAYTRAIQPASN